MTVIIRPAQASERWAIRFIVWRARINPNDLVWQRFLVAEAAGRIVGVGQVKPHEDSSRELASIAVIPAWQARGIGGQIIRALLARETGMVYLACLKPLVPYYERFEFRCITGDELPPYFRRHTWFLRMGGVAIMRCIKSLLRYGIKQR